MNREPLEYKICDVGVGTDTSKDKNNTKIDRYQSLKIKTNIC